MDFTEYFCVKCGKRLRNFFFWGICPECKKIYTENDLEKLQIYKEKLKNENL